MANRENTVVAKELRDRNDAELKSLMQSKVDELQKTRFKHALGQLSETHALKTLRRDIARLQTVLNERSREQA